MLPTERKSIIITVTAIIVFLMTRLFHDYLYLVYSPENFLAFHTILEFFSIAVSFAIVMQGWMIFPHTLSKHRLFFGALFLAVGLFDLFHTLSFKGMPFFITESSVAKATWFWISARLTEGIVLPIILLQRDCKIEANQRKIIFAISAIYFVVISYIIIQGSESLPLLVIEGKGVTQLKAGIEYFISFLHLITIFILIRNYKEDKHAALLTLILASVFILLSELIFTLYNKVYDFDNLLGHIYKVLGYYCLLKGIYNSTIEEPFILKKQKDELLSRADRLYIVGELAASISHEVRNPLSVVKGFIQLLNDKVETNLKEYCSIIIEELDRANEIISDYLSLAQNRVVKRKACNLNNIISSLYPILLADANMKGQVIELMLQDNLSNALLNEKEIRQVILNMVRNGMEAMEANGKIIISTKEYIGKIELHISDTGCGITKDKVDRLFEPFYTTKEKGTGLGLAVCMNIIKQHGGNIVVESETGQGTTFIVTFKLADELNKVKYEE